MIDVIIPAYNAHSTLERCLLSIANQTIAYKVQVIVVDDCSPDGGYKDIIDKYTHLLKIKEVKMEKNGGPGTARRVGVDNSNNPYMTFIDADDMFIDGFFFEGTLDYMEQIPDCVMVSAGFHEQAENRRVNPHTDDMVWVFGKIYRRIYWQRKRINFSDLRSNEDLELNTKIRLTLGKCPENSKDEHIHFIKDKFVYMWNYKHDSITRKNDDQGKPYEYSFNTGLIGALDAKISAYTFDGVNTELKLREIAMQIPPLYDQVHSILHERPDRKDFLENVFNKMVEFWNKLGKNVWSIVPDHEKAILFNKRNNDREQHIMPGFSFPDFVKMLDEGKLDYKKMNIKK
jgi:glycosyltransferase involved in cell wall biosynthesis